MRTLSKVTTGAAVTSGALFALSHHTEAAVIYSGLQNVGISISHSTMANRGVGLADFRLYIFRTTGRFYPSLRGSGGGFLVNNAASKPLAKLAAGQLISAGQAFYNSPRHGLFWSTFGGGVWTKSQTGFAGVKFSDSSGNSHLGWIRLAWTDEDNVESLTALDWAYNDTAGASILAGQGIPTVPEPGRALLMLAGLGSMALRRRRK